MNKIISRLVALAAGAALVGAVSSASATTSWGSLSGPGTTPVVTDTGTGGNYVKVYGSVASDSKTAATNVVNFQGQYSTAVYVQCKDGSLNSNFGTNAGATVACPFFVSTVTSATGTGSST